MRSILILFMITVTFAAKAGEIPNAIAEDNKDIGGIVNNEQREPVYMQYVPQKAETANKINQPQKKEVNVPTPPEKNKETRPNPQPDLPKNNGHHIGNGHEHQNADMDKHKNQAPQHQRRHDEPPPHKSKPESRFNVHVNIGTPHTKVLSNSGYVYSRPVTVVRPIVYENDIYANNSYSCQERSGVKYCTDYRGRALNGRIVQTYGDSVAYEQYRNGYQQGQTTVFSSDGQLMRKSEYKKSLKDGKEYVYFTNGKVEYVAEYKKGALHGKIIQYNDKGRKIGQMTYRNGRLSSRHCTYETYDPAIAAQIKQKNYNELILCADYGD